MPIYGVKSFYFIRIYLNVLYLNIVLQCVDIVFYVCYTLRT